MLPLGDVRVIAVEQYGAGPFGSLHLADLGADVVKVEDPRTGGDVGRTVPPFAQGDDSLFFQTFNLNKRSITLDLRREEGQRVLHRLAVTADAVTNNARGDLAAKLGLDYASLAPAKRDIVCVHASAYGRTGPRAGWPGYDYLMQAEAGFMAVTGAPDDPPTRFGLSMVDFMTGTMLATATLAGIRDAKQRGVGRDYDLALLDAALHQTSYPALWYLNEGHDIGRAARSAHPSVTPSQTVRTADGWVFLMAQLPKFWTLLIDELADSALMEDRFATIRSRLDHRDALTVELDRIFSAEPTDHWVARLGGLVPIAPVYELDQALDNPRIADMVDRVEHPDAPDGLRVLANPIKLDGERLPNRAGPKLGADTDAVLADAGFDPDEVAALRTEGVI